MAATRRYFVLCSNAKIQPGAQQEQHILHRLRPDKTRFVDDRAEDEHRWNVDQPLTGDIDDLSRKETALKSTNWDLDFYHVHFQGCILTLFHDTLDETSHCGRYPAIVQSRGHSMINL